MGVKRTSDEANSSSARKSGDFPKRAKLSSAQETSNDSRPSNQNRAQQSNNMRQSSISSVSSSDLEDDSEISTSSASSESSETDSIAAEEEIITIGGSKKPQIARVSATEGAAQDLRTRLTALLPQLAEANELLAQGSGDHNIEDVNEDEQHIEMSLGLGVLEEQKGEDESSLDDTDSSEDDGDREQGPQTARSSSSTAKPINAIDKLLGRRRGHCEPSIEEVQA